jgi:hypothetical protein
LSTKGKTFRIVINGEEQILQKRNAETQLLEPVSVLSLIVVAHNQKRSRSMYEGEYKEGENRAPRCWSNDGVTPDSTVQGPFSTTCAMCPKAVKGSKPTATNPDGTACQTRKRLVVVPSNKLDGTIPPLLLNLAPTSIWDKKDQANMQQGWFAWEQYMDRLRQAQVSDVAMVVTRIRFEPSLAYPKLLFNAARWVDQTEAAAALKLRRLPQVSKMLDFSASPEGQAAAAAKQAAQAQAAPPVAPPPPAPPVAPPAPVAPPVAPPVAAPVAPVAPAPAGLVLDEEIVMASPAQVAATPVPPPPAAPPTAPVVSGVPPQLAGLMEQWDA